MVQSINAHLTVIALSLDVIRFESGDGLLVLFNIKEQTLTTGFVLYICVDLF